MKKEKINSIELQRLIALKCDKLDYRDVTDNDIDKIKEISFHGMQMNGELSGIDLESLVFFKGLERLGVSDYKLTQQFIEKLLNLKNLKTLDIMRCSFEDINFKPLGNSIIRINFSGCENLNFNYSKFKVIQISGSKVNFDRIDFSDVEDLFIIESIIENAHDLSEYKNIKNVKLDGSILFNSEGKILDNLNVSKNTVYTHAAEYKVYNNNK